MTEVKTRTDSFLTPEEAAQLETDRKAFYASFGLPDEGKEPSQIDYLKLLSKAGELDKTEAEITSLLEQKGGCVFNDNGEYTLVDVTWSMIHEIQDSLYQYDMSLRFARAEEAKKAARKGETLPPEPPKPEAKLSSEALMQEYRKLKEWGTAQGFTKTELLAWWGGTTQNPDELKPTLDRLQKFKAQIARQIDDRLNREFAAMFGMKFGFEIPAEWQGTRLAYLGQEVPEEIQIGEHIFKRQSGETSMVLAGGDPPVVDVCDSNDAVSVHDDSDAGCATESGIRTVDSNDHPVLVGDGSNNESGENTAAEGEGDLHSVSHDEHDRAGDLRHMHGADTDLQGKPTECGHPPVSDPGAERQRQLEERLARMPALLGLESQRVLQLKQDMFGDEVLSEALLDQLSDALLGIQPSSNYTYHESGFRINEHGEIDIPPVLQSFGWTEMPKLSDPDIEKKLERVGDRMASMLDDCARYRANAEALCKPKEEGIKFYQQMFGKLIEEHAKSKVKLVKTGKNAGKPVSKTVVYATYTVSFEKTGGIWISKKADLDAQLLANEALREKLNVAIKQVPIYKPEDITKAIKDKVVSIDELAGMADAPVDELGSYKIKGSKKEKAS